MVSDSDPRVTVMGANSSGASGLVTNVSGGTPAGSSSGSVATVSSLRGSPEHNERAVGQVSPKSMTRRPWCSKVQPRSFP